MRVRRRWTTAVLAIATVGPLPLALAASADAASTPGSCPASTGRRIVDTPATFPRTVALTFDDGPNATYTPEMLAVLRRHRVHGTFFVVGERVAHNPALLKQVAADGNVIGNHSWDHPTAGAGFWGLDKAQVAAEIDPATRLIQHHTQRRVCFFRAPQGKDTSAAVQRITSVRGLTVTNMYSGKDYLQPQRVDATSVAEITGRLVAQGDHPILLLHDGGAFRGNSVLALDRIITWYQQRGYVFTDPAGRPFPDGLPAGTRPPQTGWAVPPAPDANLPTPEAVVIETSAIGPVSAEPSPDQAPTGQPHQAGSAVGTRAAVAGAVPV